MVSKELLSEVLGYPNDFDYIEFDDNEVRLHIRTWVSESFETINIHELAYMCKEFALGEGYWIDSNLGFVTIGKSGSTKKVKSFNGYDLKLDEPRLIIMSCEWILEQKAES